LNVDCRSFPSVCLVIHTTKSRIFIFEIRSYSNFGCNLDDFF
jgi:hypothetical protein